MVMCLIDSPSRCFETLRQGWIAAYLLTGIIAVREIVWGVHQSNYFIGVGGAVWDTGIASTFANPNNYAVALIISFVIFLTGLAQARARWSRVLYGVLLLSVAPLMFATNSRLGLVLLVAMALILARGWVSFASVIGGFALAVVISGLDILSTSFVSKHIDSFSWGSMSLASDQSFQVRKEMTLVGLRAVAESKMTGLGPGAFEDYAASHAQQGGSGAVNPHFGVIEILSQYGPVVAALVGALLVWLTIRGWRFWRQHSRTRVGTSFGGGLSVLSGAAPILSAFNSGYLEPSTTWIYLATILLWARVLPELGEGAINGDRPRQAAATGTRGRFSSA
jgi:teichuronic acid biosynthesis protein TuaE